MELDIRTSIAVGSVLAGLVSGWTYMRFKLNQLKIDIDKNEKQLKADLRDNEEEDREREKRLTKKIEDLGKSISGELGKFRDTLKTIFGKLDAITDNHANAIGDLRVTLTVMAGKFNPGNDKALIDQIRDIGKKHNGRR